MQAVILYGFVDPLPLLTPMRGKQHHRKTRF